MAITKTKHITTTLKKAIAYICNEQKTDEGVLISSFACTPETADLEFAMTAEKGSGNGKILAHHLIQSFKPGEVTPEEAHQIGMEWAQSVLGGKYEFVLTTHIDKNHVHNHLIFNATSFVHKKKYNDCRKSLKYRMRESDRICAVHGLSVIKEKSGIRGKEKYEYEQQKRGTSWKQKLVIMIDEAIAHAADWDEFITIMELNGCDCERNPNGMLKFKMLGQERFIRIARLGEKYTEEMIKERILCKNTEHPLNQTDQKSQKRKSVKLKKQNVSLLVDLQNNYKAQQSKGYKNALEVSNVNQLFKTIAFLEQNHMTTYENFEKRYFFIKKQYDQFRREKQVLDEKIEIVSEKLHYCQNFFKVAKNARMAIRNPEQADQYKNEIAVYNSCLKYFKEQGISIKDIKIKQLWEDKHSLEKEQKLKLERLSGVREEMKNLNVIKSNIDMTLGISKKTISDNKQRE